MTGLDFGLSVIASWIGGTIDRIFKSEAEGSTLLPNSEPKDSQETNDDSNHVRLYKTYDAYHDLPKMAQELDKPKVSLLIERSPSSHYNLITAVLESRSTGEWYVFSRERMAFQGSGGGYNNSDKIITDLKSLDIQIGVWVFNNKIVDGLENGYLLWPEVNKKGIPLRSFIGDEEAWETITRQAKKILDKP